MFRLAVFSGSEIKPIFTFNVEHYLRINGTAMRTVIVPTFANIFKLKKQIISISLSKPLSWFLFIDDGDKKWIKSQ